MPTFSSAAAAGRHMTSAIGSSSVAATGHRLLGIGRRAARFEVFSRAIGVRGIRRMTIPTWH
jgi:hypothetical protein